MKYPVFPKENVSKMIKTGIEIEWTMQKIIAVILLVLSFIMFFLPWISISLNVMGQKITIPKMLDYVSMYEGYSSTQFKTEFYDALVDLSEDMAWEGVHMDPNQAMATFELISDSNISPIDAARVCSFASKLLGEIEIYLTQNSQDLYGEERIAASMVTDTAGKVTFAAVMMWILVSGVLVTFTVSLYLMLKGKKYSVVPYLCMSLILLIASAVLTSKVNNGVKQIISTFSYGAASLFSELGISYSSTMDLSIFHLSIAGIFSFIFAAGALALSILDKGKLVRISIPEIKPIKKWTCPSCGSEMSAGSVFCSSCGTKRSDPLRCANCGRPIGKDVAFCPHCGTPSGHRTAPAPIIATKPCPSCGRAVPSEYSACPSCGYNFTSSSVLWGTLVKPGDDNLG